MYSRAKLHLFGLILLGITIASLGHAQQSSLNSVAVGTDNTTSTNPTTNVFPSVSGPNQPPADPAYLIHEAVQLMQKNQLDEAMVKLNTAIQLAPDNVDGYGLRGGIYASEKQWDKAIADYQRVIQMDPTNTQAKFNLAEITFMQKNYDQAKLAFVALESDKSLGDLATYKAFLCDLFAGREDIASADLAAMDQVGSGPSYYFGKAAWALYHKQMDDARSWLTSAANIYAPAKFRLYTASLLQLGYLPLTPPPQKS